jgi:hypothetical protein
VPPIEHDGKRRGGLRGKRCAIGSAPATVRLHADLLAAVKELAAAEETSLSELVRDALSVDLSTDPAQIDFRSSTVRVLSETDIKALAEEAERGYGTTALPRQLRRRVGTRGTPGSGRC